jgi:hypothetical protein
MKKYLSLCILLCGVALGQVPQTSNLHLNIPTTGTQIGTWGPLINGNFQTIDLLLACYGSASMPGTIVYFTGTHWVCLAGNSSGTQVLQETAAGIPSWATVTGLGTVTGVSGTTGGGLIGGGTSGAVTLGLLNTCAPNQVLVWNGSIWACGNAGVGTLTGVTTGGTSGLIGGGTSGTLNLSLGSCAAGQVWQSSGGGAWACATNGSGTVTGATTGFGLIGVSGSTTLAFTLSGNTGGIPCFNSASSWISSSTLTQYGVLLGGGAGVCPTTSAADSNVTHAFFATATGGAFRAVTSSDIPTLNQNTTGSAASITGINPVVNGGFGLSGTALYAVPVGLTATSYESNFTVPDCNGSSNALNFTRASLPSSDPWTCLSIATLSNPMSHLGSLIYGGVSGPGAATELAPPTTPATPFVLTSLPSGGLSTAPVWSKVGLAGRTVIGTSDTLLGSDNAHVVNYCNNAGVAGPPCTTATAVTVVLPQSGSGCGTSSDFCSNYVTILKAGPGLVTITPTTSTINGNASAQMQQQVCRLTSDNTNYQLDCAPNNSANPVNTDTGSANAYVVACPGIGAPVQKGDTCIMQAAHNNTASSTINVGGMGAGALTRQGGGTLLSGDVLASPALTDLKYDGTEWTVDNPQAQVSGISPGTNGEPYINTNSGTGNATSPLWLDSTQFTGADACARAQTAIGTSLGSTLTNYVDMRAEIKNGITCATPPQFGVPGASSAGGFLYLPMGQIEENTPLFVFGKTTYQGGCISYDIAHCSGIVSNWTTGTGGLGGVPPGGGAIGAWSSATAYFGASTATSGGHTWYSVENNNTNHTPGTGQENWWSVADLSVGFGYPSPVAMVNPLVNANGDTESYAVRDMSLNCAYAGGASNVSTLGCAGLINSWGQEQGIISNVKIQNATVAGVWVNTQLTEDFGPYGGGTVGYGSPNSTFQYQDACRTNGLDSSQDTATISSTTAATVSGPGNTILKFVLSAPPLSGPWAGEILDVVNGSAVAANQLSNIAAGLTDQTANTHAFYMVWSVTDSTHFTVQAAPGTTSCASSCGTAMFYPIGINVSYDSVPGRINQNRGLHDWTVNSSTCATSHASNAAFNPTAAEFPPIGFQFMMQDTPLTNSHVEGHRVGICVGCFGPSVGQHISNTILTTNMYTGVLIDNKFSVTGTDIKDTTCAQSGPNTNVYCIVDLINGNLITETNNSYIMHYWLDGNSTAFFEGGNCADMTLGWCQQNGVWAYYGGTTGVPSGFKQGSFGLNLVSNGTLSHEVTTAAATYNTGGLACVTATNTVGDCGSTAANSFFIGINLAKDGALPNYATAGVATVKGPSSQTWTAGDIVCTNASTAAVSADIGASTNCPGAQRQVGIVAVTNTGTTHQVTLIFSGVSVGGGGSGTVSSCGSGGLVAIYASSGTTVTCSANMQISNGALALGVASTTLGTLQLFGGTSGSLTITPQATAGTPTWTAGTSSGTPVVTASAPLGITTATGNATCATCVTSSSPGVGIAHFAGSTQAVTSSAVVAADITNATITHTQTDSTFPTLVASGTSAMGTGAITSGTCATVVTTTATGTATTDTIVATPNADPTGVTGYAVSATGSLYIQAYPTSGNVNFKVCNNTAGSLTPSALTLNWKVIR